MRRQSMQKYQGISILFFSRQSKARLVFLTSKQSKAKTSCDSKMADKTVVHGRGNQCKAEIKETSSAQCPVGLKGRRPHAPRGPTVPLLWLFFFSLLVLFWFATPPCCFSGTLKTFSKPKIKMFLT